MLQMRAHNLEATSLFHKTDVLVLRLSLLVQSIDKWILPHLQTLIAELLVISMAAQALVKMNKHMGIAICGCLYYEYLRMGNAWS